MGKMALFLGGVSGKVCLLRTDLTIILLSLLLFTNNNNNNNNTNDKYCLLYSRIIYMQPFISISIVNKVPAA